MPVLSSLDHIRQNRPPWRAKESQWTLLNGAAQCAMHATSSPQASWATACGRAATRAQRRIARTVCDLGRAAQTSWDTAARRNNAATSSQQGRSEMCAKRSMWHRAQQNHKRHAWGNVAHGNTPRGRGRRARRQRDDGRPGNQALPAAKHENGLQIRRTTRASRDNAAAQQCGPHCSMPQDRRETRAKHAMWHGARIDRKAPRKG